MVSPTEPAGREHPGLLEPDEPPAFSEWRRDARSRFVIVVDHASRYIPRRLQGLGLPPCELERHIAWDIGSLALARELSEALDAVLVAQNYSRLVIDCNRDPDVASSIPLVSESTEVPGNQGLTPAQRAARRAALFEPYHAHLQQLLDARSAAGRDTIFVAQHSMTDVFKGVPRPMHAAVLCNRDRRLADAVLDALRRDRQLVVGDNEPYFMSDSTDYTVPRHAEARGLPYVEIEVRQDLIREPAGQRLWASRLTQALREAERSLFGIGS